MLDTLQITRLSNGITVVSLAKPEAESANVAIRVRVGSRNEPEALNGASHFIEHMLFKGTARRSAKGISQAIEGQGGSINAYTDRDNTCYYAKVPYDKVTCALNVLADLFYNSVFDPRELDRERRVIAEEIRMYDDQPDSVAADQLAAQLWPGHPIGRPILGPMETVLSMPRSALLKYREAQYAPSRTLFAFSGRIRHEACVKAVERLTSHVREPRRLREPEPFSSDLGIEPFALIRRPIQQTQLALGWRTPGFDVCSRDPTLGFLSGVLGESMMSRLFQSLRERRGLCYSIYSALSLCIDTGALVIAAGCDPAKAYRGAKAILQEVRKLREVPLGAAELRRTRDYLIGRFRLRMDSSPLSWAVTRLLWGLDVTPEATLEALRAVTAEDLRQAAETFLRPENLAFTVVAPEASRPSAEVWADLLHP